MSDAPHHIRDAIPHILHQSWRSQHVPRGLQKAIRSWRTVQPKWQYMFHDDADNLRLVQTRYAELEPSFRRMTGIQRADVSRYLYMHAFGGVYADLDMELLKPLAPLLRRLRRERNASVILGQEPLPHSVLLEQRVRQTCNAFIASAPGHPFWLEVVRRLVRRQRAGEDPVSSTGPRMLERAVVAWHTKHRDASATAGASSSGVLVVDPDVFYPTWDPMQAGTFRSRCARVDQLPGAAAGGAHRNPTLATLRHRACARLSLEGFRPTIAPSAYTNHLWTHTWINGAQKVSVHDTYRIEQASPPLAGAGQAGRATKWLWQGRT